MKKIKSFFLISFFVFSNQIYAQSQPGEMPKIDNRVDLNFQFPSFSGLFEPFNYDPRGRRDPFAQSIPDKQLAHGKVHGPLLPLQQFELEALQLTGIIWDVARPRAMLRDPNGKVHIVGPNARLGMQNGYISVIREGEIVVIETHEEEGKLLSNAKVMKLSTGMKE